MISLIILFVIIILGLVVGMAPLRKVASVSISDDAPAGDVSAPHDPDGEQPLKASVVVLALQTGTELGDYLQNLYIQDYPDFETIVVCDCNAETAAMLSEEFASYPNLHITFLPPGSRRLSRRKLALTIGIKAASGDVVVTTSTIVKPESKEWLSALMQPFNNRAAEGRLTSIAATMGVIVPDSADFPRSKRSSVIYQNNIATIQWVGEALLGNPIRCAGFNMAFRRELFFELKGYSSSILLMDGDDDIFLHELSHYGDCIPVLNPGAALLTDYGDNSMRIYSEYREQYLFTRKFLPKMPFIRKSFSSWCHWLALPASILPILAGIYGIFSMAGRNLDIASWAGGEWMEKGIFSLWATLPGDFGQRPVAMIICMGVAVLLLTLYAAATASLYIKAARKINPYRLHYSPLYAIWRALWQPISNLLFRLSRRSDPAAHYTYRHN